MAVLVTAGIKSCNKSWQSGVVSHIQFLKVLALFSLIWKDEENENILALVPKVYITMFKMYKNVLPP